jgi:hypothetical protein
LFSTADDLVALPPGWHEHIMRRSLPATRYALQDRDSRRVIHAQADHSSSGLRADVNVDVQATPWLNWEWRVDDVPTRATVAEDDLDDSPARVVLAFEGDLSRLSLRDLMFREQIELFTGYRLPFATLMYTWDGQAAPESVFDYPRTSRIRYLVVESGAQRQGHWLRYRRNVRDDYRRVFGGEAGRLTSVGVLTDSDDLQSRSEAWFGDLRFD